ncbi:MAG: biotin/lipoate A/B protein ligase family protein [Mangrovibacterium sp.]
MKTLCIRLKETDPFLNLATEEYLLKNCSADIFMLWQSRNAVVVGKHQNALAEINHRYVKEKQMVVARRLSGGGTVFQDEGNLNFTFIKNVERIDQINYREFTDLMVGLLNKLGINASAGPHNAIFAGGRKISGSADHVHKLRVMHHGTLLFNSHLVRLQRALKADLSLFEDKAIQSNRSEVTNISEQLKRPMSLEEFSGFLFTEVCQSYPEHRIADLSDEDMQAIERLKTEKYCRWDWIYGYSPRYRYRNEVAAGGKKIRFSLSVEKGRIADSSWEGDLTAPTVALLGNALQSLRHDDEALRPAIHALDSLLRKEGFSAALLTEKII